MTRAVVLVTVYVQDHGLTPEGMPSVPATVTGQGWARSEGVPGTRRRVCRPTPGVADPGRRDAGVNWVPVAEALELSVNHPAMSTRMLGLPLDDRMSTAPFVANRDDHPVRDYGTRR